MGDPSDRSPFPAIRAKIHFTGNFLEQSPFFAVKESHNLMYTIISGTNRPQSNTLRIADEYKRILSEKGQEARLLSLEGLNVLERNPVFEEIERELLIPATKFVFISPEYNGSIPGVLKAMFDISDIEKVWWGKKALLTGVSTGRAGNLRGMEHLTGILNYMKVTVHHNKLPISLVNTLLEPEGRIGDTATLAAIGRQLDEFIAF
jgi:chromate reductase, NAD(P)H dehydrogenase (quinone)